MIGLLVKEVTACWRRGNKQQNWGCTKSAKWMLHLQCLCLPVQVKHWLQHFHLLTSLYCAEGWTMQPLCSTTQKQRRWQEELSVLGNCRASSDPCKDWRVIMVTDDQQQPAVLPTELHCNSSFWHVPCPAESHFLVRTSESCSVIRNQKFRGSLYAECANSMYIDFVFEHYDEKYTAFEHRDYRCKNNQKMCLSLQTSIGHTVCCHPVLSHI